MEKPADGLWTSDRDPFLRQALDGPLDSVILNAVKNLGTWQI